MDLHVPAVVSSPKNNSAVESGDDDDDDEECMYGTFVDRTKCEDISLSDCPTDERKRKQ